MTVAAYNCREVQEAKRHIGKFNGVLKDHFGQYLKKCECRINIGPSRQLLMPGQ